uniref:Phage P2 GpU n=1 Tax=Candidatus Kentrum sp. LPFa TaxID=2126335 RepID=A0A450WK91_9GAMM|nr:MAG: Phage P2 GpU [Candidatus Kentron sp. LPFa]
MRFSILGDIQFELVHYFDGLDGRFGSDYAEHARIEGKPRLQWVGDRLDEWNIELAFHHAYCDPEREIVRLRRAQARHESLSFVLATGEYKGDFVITDCNVTSRATDSIGKLLDAKATLTLKEHVSRPGERRHPAPAILRSGFSLPMAYALGESGILGPLFAERQALAMSLGIANAVRGDYRLVDAMAAAAGRDLRNAVSRLRLSLPTLDAMASGLSGLSGVLAEVSDALAVVGLVDAMVGDVGNLRGGIAEVSPSNLTGTLATVESRMTTLGGNLDRLDPLLSGMVADSSVRT